MPLPTRTAPAASRSSSLRWITGALTLGAVAALSACLGHDDPLRQPTLGVRSKGIVTVDGWRFRDANGNGALDAYEDWRLSPAARVQDLLGRMTLRQKAGLLLIETLNAGCGGAIAGTPAADFIQTQQMSRFILRNTAKAAADACDGSVTAGRSGYNVTPQQLAAFANAVQALAEAQPLGIPALFKDNPRNHYNNDPRFGISGGAGAFTEFPAAAGLAAAALGTGDMAPLRSLAAVTSAEWKAVGLRGMYGYTADLATEPRWYRVAETFTEDPGLMSDIMGTLVRGLQGERLGADSAVALTIKHFPGGGPQEMGLDPHYSFGKRQVYPGGRFVDHLQPFIAAIDAGVSSVMPYYGVPISLTYEGVTYDQTGFAFNRQIVTDLLRGRLGFQGNVNSDTGVVSSRAWGLESATVAQRVATALNAGVDVLSGFSSVQTVVDLVDAGLVTEARITEAAGRLLTEQFTLGLFENPYVDATLAASVIGQDSHRAQGLAVQRQSIVLLKNGGDAASRVLPLAAGARVYTMGMGRSDVEAYGYTVTDGTNTNGAARPSAAGHDVAILRVQVSNPAAVTAAYRTRGATTGADPGKLNPTTGQVWGAEDSCILYPAVNASCADDLGLIFGGSMPWEANLLDFSGMAGSQSWKMSPSLDEIRAVMSEIGAQRTVLAIYFRQPYVIDEASGMRSAGALLATFGVSDNALLDVLSGRHAPRGKLPFALPASRQAVIDNAPDAAGYPAADTLYPYAHGLGY